MPKTIKLVFQDCVFCGSKKEWGEEQLKIAARKHYQIEKVSFVAPEATVLMKQAVKAGVRSMPFFTDGEIFTKDLRDFAPKRNTAKKSSKKKVKKNGNNSKVQG